jgi:hypothetical protein
LFEQKNPVVMTKEWFNDKQIWLVLFHQLMRGHFISCDTAQDVAQVPVDNHSDSFSGDRAVVSNNYRRLSREERGGAGSHKFLRVSKSSSDDKENSLSKIPYTRLQPLLKNP